jgi:poly [ADP-ribose] polymerase
MPLGKLSKKHLQIAYGVLTELQNVRDFSPSPPLMIQLHLQLMTSGGELRYEHMVDASNRFYTLIPHVFGMDAPPILDNLEMIKVIGFDRVGNRDFCRRRRICWIISSRSRSHTRS